jgi:cytoskeletal protein RodZ
MNPHPGQELKMSREAKGISLEQAAKDTCLRADILRQLEENDSVDNMPEVYHRLSLRMYARYLEVPVVKSRGPRQPGDVALSPVDGCVELAYSDTMRDAPEPKKRRVVGPGTVLAVTALIILTTGLWSLNAKLSRLNFEDRPDRLPAPVMTETAVPGPTVQPADRVCLDNALYLTLVPAPAVDALTAP